MGDYQARSRLATSGSVTQHHCASLDDRQDQGREDDQAAGIKRKGRPQGGLQGIVGGRLPRVFIAETPYRSRLSAARHPF